MVIVILFKLWNAAKGHHVLRKTEGACEASLFLVGGVYCYLRQQVQELEDTAQNAYGDAMGSTTTSLV